MRERVYVHVEGRESSQTFGRSAAEQDFDHVVETRETQG